MDDLTYREFTFAIKGDPSLGLGSCSELVSPGLDGITKEEWDLKTESCKREWLQEALKSWVMDAIKFSWS